MTCVVAATLFPGRQLIRCRSSVVDLDRKVRHARLERTSFHPKGRRRSLSLCIPGTRGRTESSFEVSTNFGQHEPAKPKSTSHDLFSKPPCQLLVRVTDARIILVQLILEWHLSRTNGSDGMVDKSTMAGCSHTLRLRLCTSMRISAYMDREETVLLLVVQFTHLVHRS